MQDEEIRIVGPVLLPGKIADAIVMALRESNARVNVIDRGGYLRVGVPGSCSLTEEAVSHWLGAPFRLPSDLERVMPSFQGRMDIRGGTVSWTHGNTSRIDKKGS